MRGRLVLVTFALAAAGAATPAQAAFAPILPMAFASEILFDSYCRQGNCQRFTQRRSDRDEVRSRTPRERREREVSGRPELPAPLGGGAASA